jgi:cell division protein FtsI/penicillin-binding protein 2
MPKRPSLPSFKPEQRVKLGSLVMALLTVIFLSRMAQIMLSPPHQIREEVENLAYAYESTRTPPLARGLIFDRKGYPLTLNALHYRLAAYVDRIKAEGVEREIIVKKLAGILKRDEGELKACLEKYKLNADGTQTLNYYCLLAQEVDEAGKKSLESALKEAFGEDGKLPNWLGFEPFPVRFHPEGRLASHVLGTYLPQGEIKLGVEAYYDAFLSGKEKPSPSLSVGEIDLPLASTADGCSLILSIDRDIQRAAEAILREAIFNSGAESGVIVVQDIATGEVLAMAGYPDYNPDSPAESPQEFLANPAISSLYEPGSVFKLVTYAAALDSGLINPNSPFYDEGFINVGGHVIRNFGKVVYGNVDATKALALSINVIAVKINLSLGPQVYYTYVRRFGFDSRTGIDLPGESQPLVRFPGENGWSYADLGTNAFGQGISVTPIQMTAAIAAIANKGLLMRPRVVSGLVCDGKLYQLPLEKYVVRRVISPESASSLTQMMEGVVEYWKDYADVPGYSAAGKSGTAEIPTLSGYEPSQPPIVSFGGFVPAKNPKVAILVRLDKPGGKATGIRFAAPAFSKLAYQTMRILGVPPDEPEELSAR